MAYFLFFIGALVASYLILLLCNFGWRRITGKRNSPISLVAMGIVRVLYT